MHKKPIERLLQRLHEALLMHELSRANGTAKDGAFAVLVADALEQFEGDVEDAERADAAEHAEREDSVCF